MNGHLEEELRQALGRREAPAGFTERVMARIPKRRASVMRTFWYPALAAALAILFTFAGIEQIRHQKRLRAEETQRQVVYALQLTAEKLDRVNARLQKSAPELRFEEREGEQL
jgi:hypothetical protein